MTSHIFWDFWIPCCWSTMPYLLAVILLTATYVSPQNVWLDVIYGQLLKKTLTKIVILKGSIVKLKKNCWKRAHEWIQFACQSILLPICCICSQVLSLIVLSLKNISSKLSSTLKARRSYKTLLFVLQNSLLQSHN